MLTKGYSISNIAYISGEKIQNGSISIKNGFIDGFDKSIKYDYKLDKALIIPAFINISDSLSDTYFPTNTALGCKEDWINKEKSKLDKKTICLLGAYKNFISGVLTIFDCSDYNIDNESLLDDMPVRLLLNNSVDNDMKIGYDSTIKNNNSFVVDISKEHNKYLNNLMEVNTLTDNATLIHGISLSDKDIENVSKSKANLVWNPSFEYCMFGESADINKWLDAGINVALSSRCGSFLDEIGLAQNYYKKMYGEQLHEKILYNMISKNASRCLKLQTLGCIRENSIADLLVLRSSNKNPYKTISNITLKDIEAIIQNGLFVYANEKYCDMVYNCSKEVYTFNVLGEKRYCAYDIKKFIGRIRNMLGYIKELPFLPID